jgi:hypothetical protein
MEEASDGRMRMVGLRMRRMRMAGLRMVVVQVMVLALLAGCRMAEKSPSAAEWKETGTIQLTAAKDKGERIKADWIGVQGILAISNSPFIAGKNQKYMWLLWGNKEELAGKTLKVIATSQTGEELAVVESVLGGENWGAAASSPSTVGLPTEGLWKLDAYVDEKLHDTLIVKVT